MECQQAQLTMMDAVSEGRGSELPQALQGHVRGCVACAHEWSGHSSVIGVMRGLPELTPALSTLRKVQQLGLNQNWDGELPIFVKADLWTRLWGWCQGPGLQLAPVVLMALFMLGMGVTVGVAVLGGQQRAVQVADSTIPSQSSVVQPVLVPPTPIMPVSQRDAEDLWAYGATQLPTLNHQEPVPMTPQELEQLYQRRYQSLLESDADDLLMRGRRFKSIGRIDLALKDFETVYRFYPNYTYMADVLMYRAQCYAFQGELQKAIESLEIYQERYPAKKALIEPMILQLKDTQHQTLEP